SARQDWACILWKDAKLGDLVSSTREFINRFRQRPRRMRALPAARMLNTILKNFLESLLLIQNLKDDAMRDRILKYFEKQFNSFQQNLEDIKNIWLEMRFSISPYTKCNKEPCFILASVEEPSQIMEDHMMSLQSIGASRHATPFLAIVRQWERDLTIVSDTLD
ncbi:hypothetical protein X801_05933, partial [Opisthorchis viverrini]